MERARRRCGRRTRASSAARPATAGGCAAAPAAAPRSPGRVTANRVRLSVAGLDVVGEDLEPVDRRDAGATRPPPRPLAALRDLLRRAGGVVRRLDRPRRAIAGTRRPGRAPRRSSTRARPSRAARRAGRASARRTGTLPRRRSAGRTTTAGRGSRGSCRASELSTGTTPASARAVARPPRRPPGTRHRVTVSASAKKREHRLLGERAGLAGVGDRIGRRHGRVPWVTWTATGIASVPLGPAVWTATSSSNVARIRAWTSGGLAGHERRDPHRGVEDAAPQRVRVGHRRLEVEVRRRRPSTNPAASNSARSSASSRKFVGPGGQAGRRRRIGGRRPHRAASPSTRLRLGASQVESATRPPGRRTRRASREGDAPGRPTWLNTKLPTTASNAPAPPGSASNEPTRNGIVGWASAARRTIDGATSMPTGVRAPRGGRRREVARPRARRRAAARPVPASTAASSAPMTRPVIGARNAYESARASQPSASNRLNASGSMAAEAALPSPPSG